MRYLTFSHQGITRAGVVADDEGNTVLDVGAALRATYRTVREVIEAGPEVWSRIGEVRAAPDGAWLFDVADVVILAPIPQPVRLRDCTLFTEHLKPSFQLLARHRAATAADPEAEYQRMLAAGECDLPELLLKQFVYYNGDHLSVSGPDDVIVAPTRSAFLDYELEFAAVIGRTGANIDESDAGEYIFGYCIFNDWSARDLQGAAMRTNLGPAEGKDFERSNSFGPYIVTPDEVGNPYELEMVARVNGEEWSRGNSNSMTYSFERAVAQLSTERTIYAGEILGSGTVLSGSGFELGRRLPDGAVVELEIERLGVLRNRIVENSS